MTAEQPKYLHVQFGRTAIPLKPNTNEEDVLTALRQMVVMKNHSPDLVLQYCDVPDGDDSKGISKDLRRRMFAAALQRATDMSGTITQDDFWEHDDFAGKQDGEEGKQLETISQEARAHPGTKRFAVARISNKEKTQWQ
eukprot:m.94244 g.94244  ORF g.94244 m.94244 type:complete len:139 (-) comp21846_c0_seq1:87-503(-)